ncbi:Rad4/PNGase transglutaminase-like fold [Phytophthora cactorum]|nr:Rad4/PNGase transglutaminase-like fold [Phytophthora cactorum]
MRQQPLSYSLELLVRWFNREYKISDEVEEYATQGELITESSLMNVFFARQGRDYELAVLFAALCGALQLRYQRKTFEASFKQRPNKRRRAQNVADRLKKKLLSGDAEEKREVDEELEPESTGNVLLDEKHKNWIHVDAVRRLVNRPQEVEPLRGKAARFSYVVSIQDDGLLVDVTSRYTVQLVAEAMIERFNEDTTDQRPVTEAQQDWRDLETEEEVGDTEIAEGMPTSLEGFRKHHLYIWSVISPLRSAFKWRRLGREVKESERQKPESGNRKAAIPAVATTVTKLFKKENLAGHWRSSDCGKRPKQYGNIEVWSQPTSLEEPFTCIFPASTPSPIVGFEVRNGRPMPKMSGIVVARATRRCCWTPTPRDNSSHREGHRTQPEAGTQALGEAHQEGYCYGSGSKMITLRRSAAFSTRAEWKRQVAEGPRLQDFLSTSRARAIPAPEESLQQIHQILAEIQQAPRQETSQLLDRFGRAHTYLHGVPLQPTEELLTTSEITRLAKVFASSGVKRIRLTGGEPLLRRDLSVGITTNGITLQKKLLALQQAGVDRLNVSLDTLKPDKFAHITRRQGFTRVMNSILEAQTLGFSPLKINCVVQRRFNLDEIVDFVAFTEKHAVDVRFIEWMPFDSNRWNDETFVPFKEMMGLIQAEFPL